MSDKQDNDFTTDMRVADHIKEQIETVNTLIEDKTLPPEKLQQLSSFANRLRQSEENKDKSLRDPNLAALLPTLDTLALANESYTNSNKLYTQAVNHENQCLQHFDKAITEFNQTLSSANQSHLHQQPFYARHPAFIYDPNKETGSEHQNFLTEQKLIEENLAEKKGFLINRLLQPTATQDQGSPIGKLRAQLRALKSDLDSAEKRFQEDPDGASKEGVKLRQIAFEQKSAELLQALTATVIQPTANRLNERAEIDSLVGQAKEATPAAKEALIAIIKTKKDEYIGKYGENAFLEDSILRYKQAESDSNVANKAVAASQAKIDLDKAADNRSKKFESKATQSNALTQTKEKVKPILEKCMEALKKLASKFLDRSNRKKIRYEKEMQAHQNVMDCAPKNNKP